MGVVNLDMDVLRTLVVTQQLGSLHRAADRIGRSQSAVSQQMKKLEEQVGCPLLRKEGRRLVLTNAGETVLSYARRILDLNDETLSAVRGASVEGLVRFGLPGDFAETWLPAALGVFKRTHPSVRVEIAVERNGSLLERLDRDELDLVLAMGYGARGDAERVAMLDMAWIGPAGSSTEIELHRPLDLALYNSPCFFRRAGLAALDAADIAWRVAYTTASLQSLWAGVAAGLGITVRTASGLPASLKQLHPDGILPVLPSVELCLHDNRRTPSPALAMLKDIVSETARQNLLG